MRDTDFAYCVARLRARESDMLSKADFKKLIETNDYENAVNYLKDKKWIRQGENIQDFLAFQRKELWTLISESVPQKSYLKVLCVLNDFFNIKVAVKCLLSHKEPDDYFSYPTAIEPEKIRESLKSKGDFKAFDEKSHIAQNAYDVAVRTENGQYADIIIDKAALQFVLEYAKETKDGIQLRISEFICDSSNIKIACRCVKAKKDRDFMEEAVGECVNLDRAQLIEAALSGEDDLFAYLNTTVYSEGADVYKKSSTDYDRWCESKILEIAADARYTAFGFSPVCHHYYKKSSEIKTVGFILNALMSGVESEKIRERVGCIDV